jgi:hypothetical protein
MDGAKLGIVVGLLLLAFALAAIAAGYTMGHWMDTVALARSRVGLLR